VRGLSRSAQGIVSLFADERARRHTTGYILSALGIAFVAWTLRQAMSELGELRSHPPGDLRVLAAIAAAHVIVGIAAVYFGYQLIRAGERMLVPSHLTEDETKIEVLRVLLGGKEPIASPAEAVQQGVEKSVELLKTGAGIVAQVTGKKD
jgi:hypothetical protein